MITLSRQAPLGVSASNQRQGIIAKSIKMLAVARQRRALRNLDDHQLADIGLSRKQAQTEADRRPWDVPAHWRA